MNDIVIFEKDWGNLVFSFCFTLWDYEMREFNRANRESMCNKA